MEDCESCSKKLFSSNNPTIKTNSNLTNGSNIEVIDNDRQIRELELELAQTKLALVEAECKNQVCNCKLLLKKLNHATYTCIITINCIVYKSTVETVYSMFICMFEALNIGKICQA